MEGFGQAFSKACGFQRQSLWATSAEVAIPLSFKAPEGVNAPPWGAEGKPQVGFPLAKPKILIDSYHTKRTVEGLAAARSRHGSDTTPWCHSLPWRRFATPVPTFVRANMVGSTDIRLRFAI